MKKLKYEMVVCDVDGTLLPYGNQEFSKRIYETFDSLKKQGIVTVLASGREMVTIKDFPKRLNADYFIGANGSFVYDVKKKNYIVQNFPSFHDSWIYHEEISKKFPGIGMTLTDDNFIYTSVDNMNRNGWFLKPFQEKIREFRDYDGLKYINTDTFALLTVSSRNPQALEWTREWLENYPMLAISAFWASGWFIQKAGVNKYSATEQLADALGIPHSKVMTFGDGQNDYELVHHAAHGVAMANSVDEILAATKHHARSVVDDGVFHYLKQEKII